MDTSVAWVSIALNFVIVDTHYVLHEGTEDEGDLPHAEPVQHQLVIISRPCITVIIIIIT